MAITLTEIRPKNFLLDNLSNGIKAYTDEDVRLVEIPDLLKGMRYIRFPNKDRSGRTFRTSQPTTIYIGYDARAVDKLPRWLLGYVCHRSLLHAPETLYTIWYRIASGGAVSIPDMPAAHQDLLHYLVFVKETEQLTQGEAK